MRTRINQANWLVLVAIFLPFTRSLTAAPVQSQVVEFNCQIGLESDHRASVVIIVAIEGADHLPQKLIAHTLLAYEQQKITDFSFSSEAVNLPFNSERDHRLTRYTFTLPSPPLSEANRFRYTARYSVAAESKEDLQRIPLLVPVLRTPAGTRVVRIQARIANDEFPSGDSFPRFNWEGARLGSVVLGNVPAFVKVTTRPPAAVSVLDRLSNPDFLNDAFIIALIILASVIWKVRYRKE